MPTVFRPPIIFRNWSSGPRSFASVISQTNVYGNSLAGLLSQIAFDAASNSGYQTAQSTYSWNHTCSGANRYLVVGISMLSVAGSTVTSITYNGVALSLISAKASVSGAVRAELWGLVAPALGTNTISVTLSTGLDSIGSASSYSNVNQISPTEGAANASATNVGAADATVDVATTADNDWCVDIVATDDTAITVGSGQVQRNNTSGTLGSGAMSTEGPKSPAGTVTMSWANIGALATWSIVSVALIPITGGSQAYTLTAGVGAYSLTGVSAVLTPSVAIGAGSYSLAGQSAVLTPSIAIGVGSYSLSGQAALFNINALHAIGSYTLTGNNAILTPTLIANVGNYTMSGQSTLFNVNGLHAVGTYTLTGQATILTPSILIGVGAYTLSGQNTLFPLSMAESVGSYILTGQAANLMPSINIGTGSYSLSGKATAFSTSLSVDAGSYILTGVDAFLLSLTVQATRRPFYQRGTATRQSTIWRGVS